MSNAAGIDSHARGNITAGPEFDAVAGSCPLGIAQAPMVRPDRLPLR